jgi:hypothetical protein
MARDLGIAGGGLADVLPGMLIAGLGLGTALVSVALSVLTGAAEDEAGMLSGLNTTGHELGGSLGVAVLVTVATGSASGAGSPGWPRPGAGRRVRCRRHHRGRRHRPGRGRRGRLSLRRRAAHTALGDRLPLGAPPAAFVVWGREGISFGGQGLGTRIPARRRPGIGATPRQLP